MKYNEKGNLVIERIGEIEILDIQNAEDFTYGKFPILNIIFKHEDRFWHFYYDIRNPERFEGAECEEVEQVEIVEKRWLKKQSQV